MTVSHKPSGTKEYPLRILHLEDSAADHQLVVRALKKGMEPFHIQRVETLQSFRDAVEQQAVDVILADYRLAGFTALDAWETLSKSRATSRPPFILLSGAIGEAAAVSAIHLGMSDFLSKDELEKLWRVVHRSLEMSRTMASEAKANAELALSERRLAEFADHLQTTIENERASIAREIHDDIGGSLAAVKLDLAWLQRHVDDPKICPHIESAGEMLQHALGASQRIMMNLRPAILDQGLHAALQWLAQSFEKRTGIKTSLCTNNEFVSPERAIQLVAYRTTQEALTNISKYAECSAVRIEISDAEGVLTIDVSDNGKGFSADDLGKSGSFGIRGLKERAKSVGGWLDVSSQTGRGSAIILSVPLTHTKQMPDEDQFQ